MAGCSDQKSATAIIEPTNVYRIMAASLPKGWSICSPSDYQLRLTELYFSNSQAKAFIGVGQRSNHIDWIDRFGKSHSETLAKECLYLWIVPASFKPRFPRFGSYQYFYGPILPEQIWSLKGVDVYGYVSHYVADTNRMNAILRSATQISSPSISLSWVNWKKDISNSLNEGVTHQLK